MRLNVAVEFLLSSTTPNRACQSGLGDDSVGFSSNADEATLAIRINHR